MITKDIEVHILIHVFSLTLFLSEETISFSLVLQFYVDCQSDNISRKMKKWQGSKFSLSGMHIGYMFSVSYHINS